MDRLRLTLLGAVAGVFCAVGVLHFAHADAPAHVPAYKDLDRFATAFARVRASYITQPDDFDLIEGAIDGMLTNLDAHSSYFDPQTYSEMLVQTEGNYGGIGLIVAVDGGIVKVVTPMQGAPAAKAGIKTGDILIAVDKTPMAGLDLDAVQGKLRGAAGTTIALTVKRPTTGLVFDVALKRAEVEVEPVTWKTVGDIGYLRIPAFNDHTAGGVEEGVKEMTAENPGIKGYIIDLRNNGGGLLDASVAVADDFLDGGEIVSTRGRNPQDETRYDAKPGDIINGLPLVVLINAGTASASEIFAGAVQDHGRAKILGTVSFGKGSVQTIIPLNGGDGGALHLTTARYYTPSGHSIQSLGIIPDITVQQPPKPGEDTVHIIREASLAHHLEAEDGMPTRAQGAVIKAEPDANEDDFQLRYAVDLLDTPPPPPPAVSENPVPRNHGKKTHG
ncbi:MAG TPA: S41 family peptidase [Rhizomicrobium sp.]